MLNAVHQFFHADFVVSIVTSTTGSTLLHLLQLSLQLTQHLTGAFHVLCLTTFLVHLHRLAHLLNAVHQFFDADVVVPVTATTTATLLHLLQLSLQLTQDLTGAFHVLSLATLLVHLHRLAHLLNAVHQFFHADFAVPIAAPESALLHLLQLGLQLTQHLTGPLHVLSLATFLVHLNCLAHLVDTVHQFFDADFVVVDIATATTEPALLHLLQLSLQFSQDLSSAFDVLSLTLLLMHLDGLTHLLNSVEQLLDTNITITAGGVAVVLCLHEFVVLCLHLFQHFGCFFHVVLFTLLPMFLNGRAHPLHVFFKFFDGQGLIVTAVRQHHVRIIPGPMQDVSDHTVGLVDLRPAVRRFCEGTFDENTFVLAVAATTVRPVVLPLPNVIPRRHIRLIWKPHGAIAGWCALHELADVLNTLRHGLDANTVVFSILKLALVHVVIAVVFHPPTIFAVAGRARPQTWVPGTINDGTGYNNGGTQKQVLDNFHDDDCCSASHPPTHPAALQFVMKANAINIFHVQSITMTQGVLLFAPGTRYAAHQYLHRSPSPPLVFERGNETWHLCGLTTSRCERDRHTQLRRHNQLRVRVVRNTKNQSPDLDYP